METDNSARNSKILDIFSTTLTKLSTASICTWHKFLSLLVKHINGNYHATFSPNFMANKMIYYENPKDEKSFVDGSPHYSNLTANVVFVE